MGIRFQLFMASENSYCEGRTGTRERSRFSISLKMVWQVSHAMKKKRTHGNSINLFFFVWPLKIWSFTSAFDKVEVVSRFPMSLVVAGQIFCTTNMLRTHGNAINTLCGLPKITTARAESFSEYAFRTFTFDNAFREAVSWFSMSLEIVGQVSSAMNRKSTREDLSNLLCALPKIAVVWSLIRLS